eukprot:467403-Amphidinium_carterae.1
MLSPGPLPQLLRPLASLPWPAWGPRWSLATNKVCGVFPQPKQYCFPSPLQEKAAATHFQAPKIWNSVIPLEEGLTCNNQDCALANRIVKAFVTWSAGNSLFYATFHLTGSLIGVLLFLAIRSEDGGPG